MLQFIDGKIGYNYEYCQQCGACCAVCPQNAIILENDDTGLKEIIVDSDKCIHCKRCVNVCPANRKMISDSYISNLASMHYYMSYNENNNIRHLSSSGGACKTIIIECLKENLVDGVYSLRKLDTYPSAIGEFYTKDNIPSYDELPNSVYHSVMACSEISKVQKVKKLMIVGTSCQLYALEKALKGRYEELIKICIFCKQQKHLGCTRFLAKAIGTDVGKNLCFTSQYRGKGWPGVVCINNKSLKWEHAAGLPFGRRLWCVPGCNICGDPFGLEINADITLMDPWSIRKENNLGETLITVHTNRGKTLVEQIPHLVLQKATYEEIRPALGENDIWRKRATVPYFLGEQVSYNVKLAGDAEVMQRKMFESLLDFLPRMPFIFYRLLNKLIPKKRDQILKVNL